MFSDEKKERKRNDPIVIQSEKSEVSVLSMPRQREPEGLASIPISRIRERFFSFFKTVFLFAYLYLLLGANFA